MIYERESVGGATFLTFTNGLGLSLTLCDVGASVYCVRFDDKVMTMVPLNKEDFIADKGHYYGQTVGPIPMHYKKGKYQVVDKTYSFPPNHHGNALHSSIYNYGFLHYESEVTMGRDATTIVFKAKSDMPKKAGENVAIEVTYVIYEKQTKFELRYNMVPEENYCLNPTNHIYWNLGLHDIKSVKLTLPSSYHLAYDKELLIKKRRLACKGIYDFRQGKKIGKDIFDKKLQEHATHGYDHYFFLDEGKIVAETSNIRLTLLTSAEGVQLYTGNYPSENNRLLGMNGEVEEYNSGFTLETLDDPRPYGLPFTAKGQSFTQQNTFILEKIKA